MSEQTDHYSDLFNRFLARILDKGLMTAQQVAAACGVQPGQVSNYKHGKNRPDVGVMIGLYHNCKQPGMTDETVATVRTQMRELLLIEPSEDIAEAWDKMCPETRLFMEQRKAWGGNLLELSRRIAVQTLELQEALMGETDVKPGEREDWLTRCHEMAMVMDQQTQVMSVELIDRQDEHVRRMVKGEKQ